MADLLACPHCAHLHIWVTHPRISTQGPTCENCGASAPTAEAWNRRDRPPTDQPAAGDDKEELLAERPELAFCPERCPKCESDDLHSAAIGEEEAVSCCDCDWIATYTNLREAMLNAGIPHSVPCAAQETPIDLQELKRLAEKATPQDLESSELIDTDETHECPFCDGGGDVDGETYTNYDGVAIGVQFFGVGQEFVNAKNYFRAVAPKKILALISELSALRSTESVAKETEIKKLSEIVSSDSFAMTFQSVGQYRTGLLAVLSLRSTHPADSNKEGV